MSEDNSAWYQTWFDTAYYHTLYQDRDVAEAKFFLQNLIRKLSIESSDRILDVACGRGRHALYLAEQGFSVSGLDLSPNSISYAKSEASKRGLSVSFYVHDMRTKAQEEADVILNVFTSIGYFEDKSDNTNAIRAFYDSLSSGGRAVIDFMHVPLVKQNLVNQEEVTKGGIVFNLSRAYNQGWITKKIVFYDQEKKHTYQERVSALELNDFKQMFQEVGFTLEHTFGNYALAPFDSATAERLILVVRK